jgi:hypothetical protein
MSPNRPGDRVTVAPNDTDVRSILVGDLRMSFNDADGARVERVGPRPSADALLRPRFRPRRTVEVPPGRAAEVERALSGLRSGDPVEFHAPCGFGKSTLLQCIAARAEAELGVPAIYLQAPIGEDAGDILQRLMWKLYAPERPAKLTAEECAKMLRRARAKVVLDDVSFGPPDAARLIRLLSGCGVVLGSTRPVIGRHGTSWMLPGLSDEVTIGMVGNVLGRTLTGDERAALIRLAEAVEGRPLHLRQAAALVDAGEHSFAYLAGKAERDPAELDRLSVGALAAPERRLLAMLAFTAGALLPRELLRTIRDLARVDEALAELRRKGLADHHDDRFGLPVCQADSYRPLLYQHFDLAGAAQDVAQYLLGRDPTSTGALSATDGALALIEYAAGRGQWQAVAKLARVVRTVLTLAGLWYTAARVLDLGLKAAQALGERAAEALFAHDRGTLALCQGERAIAQEHLAHALDLRQHLGDLHGADLTRHNMTLHRAPWWRRTTVRRATVAGLAAAVLVAALGLTGIVWPEDDPPQEPQSPEPTDTPNTPTDSPTSSGPPTSTTSPPLPLSPEVTGALDFGWVNISPGVPAATQHFTVTNPNADPIILVEPALTGDQSFSLVGGTCAEATLAPGGTCTLEVTYTPAQLGHHGATLSISDRDGRTTSPELTGTGYVELRVEIVQPSGPGTVKISNPPTDCSSTCTVQITQPSTSLTAIPEEGFYVVWDAARCPETFAKTCELRLTADTVVSARFLDDED